MLTTSEGLGSKSGVAAPAAGALPGSALGGMNRYAMSAASRRMVRTTVSLKFMRTPRNTRGEKTKDERQRTKDGLAVADCPDHQTQDQGAQRGECHSHG